MVLRKAILGDVDVLIRLRLDYLREDRGTLSPAEEEAITGQLLRYFPRAIADNSCVVYLAEEGGQILSTAFLTISERPANPSFITGIVGTLSNVLTYPAYRRRGLATRVISAIIGEARRLGVSSIDLSATADGKPLYEKLGFHVSHYTAMRLMIEQ